MKLTVRIAQWLVGLLFIVSGLVKANDPLGLSYKMQEFFELWNSSLNAGHFFLRAPLVGFFEFLHGHSLALSIGMITLEIAAGVALLLGWKRNFILYLLLLLILFFTFLTGYAYLSGKFTNCGCFGDCIPITPYGSFLKDIGLLFLILILLFGRTYLQPLLTMSARNIIVLLSVLFTLGIQWYALNHLPIVDCLPFKKGNNIAQQMKPQPGAVQDSFAIRFIYEKNGKQFEFAPEQLPADFTTYKFIDRKQTLVRKGNAEPKIKGFALSGVTGEDSTNIVLQQPIAFVLYALDLDGDWINKLSSLSKIAKEKNVPFYVCTPSAQEALKHPSLKGISDIQYFNLDFTVVRTVARTNPTFTIMENGTIVKKYSSTDLDKVLVDIRTGNY